jgi:hypothetical protein
MNSGLLIKYQKTIKIVSAVTAILLVTAVFSRLYFAEENINLFFCTDGLYLPSLYKDLIQDGNSIADWHLNPAPNFFPDMICYFVIMFFCKNFITATFIFAIIQYSIIAFLLIKVFCLIFPDRSEFYHSAIYIFLAIFLLESFYFSRDFPYLYYLLINSYHTGAFVMSLVCFIITIKYILKPKFLWLLALFFIGFLCIISDRLFISLYVIPATLTCVLMYRRIKLKYAIYLCLTTVLFTISGLQVFDSINRNTYFILSGSGALFDVNAISHSYKIFSEQIIGMSMQFGFRAITIWLFLLSLVFMIYLFFYTRKRGDNIVVFYSAFSVIFSISVISVPIISGKFEGYDCLRYNIYPVYLGGLNCMIFVAYWLKNRRLLLGGAFSVCLISVCLFIFSVTQIQSHGLNEYFAYYPDIARRVDAIAEKENLKYGVGNYWRAKQITMFSKKGVRVFSVFDDIAIYDHVSNDRWFFNNIFNFVVLNNFRDTLLYRKKLKRIEVVSNTPELMLAKASPFYYNRATGYRVLNIGYKEK